MTLQIADDLDRFLRSEDRSAEQTAREIIVLDLFRQRKISGGKASELLGVDRGAFIHLTADHDIPYFNLTSEEFEQELEAVDLA